MVPSTGLSFKEKTAALPLLTVQLTLENIDVASVMTPTLKIGRLDLDLLTIAILAVRVREVRENSNLVRGEEAWVELG